MTSAAASMEALNGLYKMQLDSASKNAEANKEIAENAAKIKRANAVNDFKYCIFECGLWRNAFSYEQ